MLYCTVCFSSTTVALVPLIIGRQLVELCVFLATCHWHILCSYMCIYWRINWSSDTIPRRRCAMSQVFCTSSAQRWTRFCTTWCRCVTVAHSTTPCKLPSLQPTADAPPVQQQPARRQTIATTGRWFTAATPRATSATRRLSAGGPDRPSASKSGRCRQTARWSRPYPDTRRWLSQSAIRCRTMDVVCSNTRNPAIHGVTAAL